MDAQPDPLPETARIQPIQTDRQAFVRVDTNRYSVPIEHAEKVRTLVVDDRVVRVLDGQIVIAEHVRSCWRRQVIELASHRATLVAERRAARDLKGRDRLRAVAPTFDGIVKRWDTSGSALGRRVSQAIKLLDLYGDHVFAAAAADIDARGLADVAARLRAAPQGQEAAGSDRALQRVCGKPAVVGRVTYTRSPWTASNASSRNPWPCSSLRKAPK